MPDFTFKLLMLGDASVGKTSLTHRYITGVFVDSPRLTIGVDFFSKKIRLENSNSNSVKTVKIQIWDFGGEERFRFLLPTYSKGSNAAFFLYDITSRKTFESLSVWIQIIRKHAGNIPIFLIGSKKDLVDHRQISFEEASQKGKEFLLTRHIELSAKTGENVEESFQLLTELLLKKSKEISDIQDKTP